MKIHLRKRKLIKNGNISLYFEIYKGAISTNEGRTKPIRNYECLYLIDNPQTPFNKQHNKDTLALAESIKAKREQIPIIAEILQTDPEELLTLRLADQVTAVVTDEKKLSNDVLKIVKENLMNKK